MVRRELYRSAEQNNVQIVFFRLPNTVSVSMEDNHEYYIAVDPFQIGTTAQWNTHLAHELGHCVTGSFYAMYSPLDIRDKHELAADKWAVKKLIPKDELNKAMKNGCTEVWQLAEYFDVTEDFIRRAIYIHFEIQPMR